MIIDYDDASYICDLEGNTWQPGEDKESMAIAQQMAQSLVEDGMLDLYNYKVKLILIKEAIGHCEVEDSEFIAYFEDSVEFNVVPICYMDMVIDIAIKNVVNDWEVDGDRSIDDVSHLVKLEEDLIKDGYESEELKLLTALIKPFKTA